MNTNILIIDDQDDAFLVAQQLNALGYNADVTHFPDFRENDTLACTGALKILERDPQKYQILLIDFNFDNMKDPTAPIRNGIQLAKFIKNAYIDTNIHSHLALILLTAYDTYTDIKDYIAAQVFDGFLVKEKGQDDMITTLAMAQRTALTRLEAHQQRERAVIAEEKLSIKEGAVKQLNEQMLIEYAEWTQDDLKEKVVKTLFAILDLQEKVFEKIEQHQIKDWDKMLLARAMHLMENNMWETGVDKMKTEEGQGHAEKRIFKKISTKPIFFEIKEKPKTKGYTIPDRPDSTYTQHFKVYDKTDRIKEKALYTRFLIEKNPQRWIRTLEVARQNKAKKSDFLPTFIDEIVKEFNL